MNALSASDIVSTYLHVKNDGSTDAIAVSPSFWEALAQGQRPELDQGRLMSAYSFSESWPSWERHPAGEELVMLLSGVATVVLEMGGAEQIIELTDTGAFLLVPPNTWHTVRTTIPTKMLFLTPGAGTEHRAV